MFFSIIIINYKTKETTGDCLEAVLKLKKTNNLEVILIDNNSESGDVEYLKNRFDNEVIFISSNKNLGFGGGNNLAAKKAKGDILFFLNSDTIIENDVFSELMKHFNDNQIGVVSPLLLNSQRLEQAYGYGVFPDLKNLFIKKNDTFKNNKKTVEVDWVSGAAILIRKNIFYKLGGFDDNFFMYFEDIDLCRRVKKIGYKVVVDRNVSITHLGGKSVGKFSKRKRMYYNSQNYYYKKYYGLFAMIIMRTVRAPYRFINYLRFK